MGATATMLYGITLLLDPLPPETYKNQPPMAEQTRRKWGPSWRKPWGKKKRKASDLDGAGSVKDVRPLPQSSRRSRVHTLSTCFTLANLPCWPPAL